LHDRALRLYSGPNEAIRVKRKLRALRPTGPLPGRRTKEKGMLTHKRLVEVLESRFDYYSARVMAKEALAAAGLSEKPSYDGADIAKVAEALSALADRTERVTARLTELAPARSHSAKAAEAEPTAEAEAPAADEADDSSDEASDGGDGEDSGDEAGGKSRASRRRKK
jgi:hypothetical protein